MLLFLHTKLIAKISKNFKQKNVPANNSHLKVYFWANLQNCYQTLVHNHLKLLAIIIEAHAISHGPAEVRTVGSLHEIVVSTKF